MKLKHYIPFLIVIIVLQSCKNDVSLDKLFDVNTQNSALEGKRHILEEDGIQILLPEIFERYSLSEYEAVLDSLTDKKTSDLELQRLKNMRDLDGNNYIFFAPNANASYFVNTIPYAPILKQDAQKLLGIIRQNQRKASETIPLEYKKITAKYSAITNAQIFKAIFQVYNKKNKSTSYQHTYFISSKGKSVLLNLSVAEDINFDPYIEKIIF